MADQAFCVLVVKHLERTGIDMEFGLIPTAERQSKIRLKCLFFGCQPNAWGRAAWTFLLDFGPDPIDDGLESLFVFQGRGGVDVCGFRHDLGFLVGFDSELRIDAVSRHSAFYGRRCPNRRLCVFFGVIG